MTRLLSLLLCLFFAGQGARPDPFIGEWRENPAKGHTTPANEITVDLQGLNLNVVRVRGSFAVTLDGIKRPSESGTAVTWNEPYGNGWVTRWEQNGKLLSESFYVLGPDDKIVNSLIRYTAQGEQKQSTTFDRIVTGEGINGRWRPRPDVPERPDVLRFTVDSGSMVTITYTDGRIVPSEAVDGQIHSATAGPNSMIDQVSNRRIDERTIERIASKAGKPRFRSRFQVDSTGTILTRVDEMFLGEPTAVTVTTVYEKQ